MGLEVLYLVRHSQPVSSHPLGDRYRPLTTTGRVLVGTLVSQALARGFAADLALTSPYVRAVETRDLFVAALGARRAPQPGVPEPLGVLRPDEDPDDVVAELEAWGQDHRRLAVFTHNPLVTAVAERLVEPGSVPSAGVDALAFGTPTMVALTFPRGFGPLRGHPEWILHP